MNESHSELFHFRKQEEKIEAGVRGGGEGRKVGREGETEEGRKGKRKGGRRGRRQEALNLQLLVSPIYLGLQALLEGLRGVWISG